jgi:hypothetical protein
MSTTEQLVDLIRNNEHYTKAATHYVSIYSKEQLYGGPEEGGWWHTCYTLEGSVSFPTYEQAEAFLVQAEHLAGRMKSAADRAFRDNFVNNHRDDVDYEDDFCTGETCGSEDYLVCIEQKQGEMDNSDEPIGHYE